LRERGEWRRRERASGREERKLSHLWSSSFEPTFLRFSLHLSFFLLLLHFLSERKKPRGGEKKRELPRSSERRGASLLSGDSRPLSRCPGENGRGEREICPSSRFLLRPRVSCPARAPALEKKKVKTLFLSIRAPAAAQTPSTHRHKLSSLSM
jgi:hypothetical protein